MLKPKTPRTGKLLSPRWSTLPGINVGTTTLDLYATPDTFKGAVKQARNDLVSTLASEADIHISEIPLAIYLAAIRAVHDVNDWTRLILPQVT